jgi:hypothetical protein
MAGEEDRAHASNTGSTASRAPSLATSYGKLAVRLEATVLSAAIDEWL